MSAAIVLFIGLVIFGVIIWGTRTQAGRDVVRRYVLSELSRRVKGKVYLGRFRGSLFGDITVDSIEIRESNDSLFFASGPISLRFRPGDLIDRRVRLAYADVVNPQVHIRRDSSDTWNFRRIFPSGPPRAPRTTRGFGDYIVLDSLRMRGGSFAVTMPWQPDDTLRGTKRDSAIAFNLTRTDREVRRVDWGFTRTFRWTDVVMDAGYIRVAHPDSTGQFFTVHRLDVNEQVPPFKFSNIRGTVTIRGDTVFPEVAHFQLPASRGRATGTVSWKERGPPRYNLRIEGEQVALADVNWVYPTLPTTGGGPVRLHIINERDPDVIEYALSEMDVRTGPSRLRGDMTFAVGGPVLEVRNVTLNADPVDFALLEHIAGEPFRYPWRGSIYGTVNGRGGPLTNFQVDNAQVEFRDANVPGAVTRGSAKGGLNILKPAFTVFRGFDVQLAQLDLRTLQYLDPEFPKLNGIVSGSTRLDSLWLDVRFSNADLTHRDGDSPASHVRGNGRVTVGDSLLSYDLALTADSLSFTTLARSYPSIRLRGQYGGPMRINGTLADLNVNATLRGAGGSLAIDGTLDGTPPSYGFNGTLDLANVDLRTLLDTTAVPRTALNARLTADLRGDTTLASLAGRAELELDRSLVDSVRLFPSRGQFRFADGRARIDTLILESVAGHIDASGGLGLTRSVRDSIRFVLNADSLGALRRYLTRAGDTTAALDSLTGTVDARGIVSGRVDSFTVAARVDGRSLRALGQRARAVRGDITFSGLPKDPHGTADIALDTIRVAGVSLVDADLHLGVQPGGAMDASVGLQSMTGPTARAVLHRSKRGDTVTVAVDSLSLRIDEQDWSLERPSSVLLLDGEVDVAAPLSLVGEKGARGRIAVQGSVPRAGDMNLRITIDSVALSDLGKLSQSRLSLDGRLSLTADIKGTRSAPLMDLKGAVNGAAIGEFRIARGDLTGSYADRSLTAKLSLYRDSVLVLTGDATLPVDLAFERRADRTPDTPLKGTIRSNDVHLALLESFTPLLQRATGRFNANLDLGGTWGEPSFTGTVRVTDGAFSWARLGAVRIRNANADIQFLGDSVHVNRLVAVSGKSLSDSAWVKGWIEFSDLENPTFDIDMLANNFAAIENRSTAELTLSGEVRLLGALRGSTLTGRVLVNQGVVYIPELVRKEVVSLDDPSVAQLIDTTLFTNRSLLPSAPPTLVRNLTIREVRIVLGDDVWLRSREANIKLEGSLDVTKGTLLGTAAPQLALEGTLETVRGTYVLALAGGVVRRLFEVESGTLRFFGEPDFNPTLNIRAIHRVALLGAADLGTEARIRVILEGTLARPSIRLENAGNLRYSESDLLSLLVTGAPSLEQGASNAYISGLLGILTGSSTNRLREALSLDLFQIRSSVVRGTQSGLGRDLLRGSSLGIGKQVGERSFLTLSYGLCALAGGANNFGLAETLGLRFEHRLQAGFGFSVSREPASLNATCGTTGARTFTATPAQYGLDLFRAWRY